MLAEYCTSNEKLQFETLCLKEFIIKICFQLIFPFINNHNPKKNWTKNATLLVDSNVYILS